jgi:hypothetical protein
LAGTVALAGADGITKELVVGGLTAGGTAIAGYIGRTFIVTLRISGPLTTPGVTCSI